MRGDKVNVNLFPAGKWHEHDGGKYIGTEVIIINKDPDSDWVNIGTYRVMIQDDKTLSVFIEPGKHGSLIREKWWAQGKHCPMVVCVGQPPVLGMVASAKTIDSHWHPTGSQLRKWLGGTVGFEAVATLRLGLDRCRKLYRSKAA